MPLNLIQLTKYARIQATDAETAAGMKLTMEEFLYELETDPEARKTYDQARTNGQLELREKEFSRAVAGDTTAMKRLSDKILVPSAVEATSIDYDAIHAEADAAFEAVALRTGTKIERSFNNDSEA